MPQSSGNARSMTKLLYSDRFASDLAWVTSANIERKIFDILDAIEAVDDIGSKAVPESIRSEFGAGVSKLAVNPFVSSIPTMPNAISFSLKRQFTNAPPGSRDPPHLSNIRPMFLLCHRLGTRAACGKVSV